MTEKIPNPIADALAAVSEAPRREEARDPALEAADAALEATLEKHRIAATGADPLLDGQIVALGRRTVELDRVVEDARRLRAQGETGAVPGHIVEAAIRRAEDEVRKANEAALKAARAAGQVGRERLIADLLPEPAPSDRTAETKADLRDALAAYTDPHDAFTHAFEDALKAKANLEIALLAGRWGERAFRARGGTEEGWQTLRQSFYERLAERAKVEDPRGRAAKAWSVVLGNDYEKVVSILQVELDRKRERVRK